MTENAETEAAQIGIRLVDDAYMSWFYAESECERALHTWFEGARGKRAMAYVAYRAALDREEAAARDLERLWELAQPCRAILAGREEGVRE